MTEVTARFALVTGASGFVGSAVARRLVEQGWRVRVLLRPSSDRRNIDGLPVEVFVGALGDIARFDHHAAGDVARLRLERELVERRAGQDAERVEGQVAPQLDPEIAADVGAYRRLQPGSLEDGGE